MGDNGRPQPEPDAAESKVTCACGAAWPADFRFCGACGLPLAQEPAATEVEERKVVTALFADLAASTELASRLDPEDFRAVLRPFFTRMAEDWPLDQATLDWQRSCLRRYDVATQDAMHQFHWRRQYGDRVFPPIRFAPHHYTHAFQAAMESPFESAVTLTVDGSGDEHTAVLWVKRGGRLSPRGSCRHRR